MRAASRADRGGTSADNAGNGRRIPDEAGDERDDRVGHRPGVGLETVIRAGDRHQPGARRELRRPTERVPVTLDDEHRLGHPDEFGEAAPVRAAGRVQREGQRHHAGHRKFPRRAAGHPGAEAAAAGDQRRPGEPDHGSDRRHRGEERSVELPGRRRSPPPGHPVGLLHAGHGRAGVDEPAGDRDQVHRLHATARTVPEHDQQPRPARTGQVDPGRSVGRFDEEDVLPPGGVPHGYQGRFRRVSLPEVYEELRLPDGESPYWAFYDAVVARQLGAWLPPAPARVLDLSGARSRCTAQLSRAGHTVVQAFDSVPRVPTPAGVSPVVADLPGLGWLVTGSVDAVLAEGRALSLALAAELAFDEIARVLRPGGRFLVSVDSLVLGLARLAQQGRWAELADVPGADVVLVPSADGRLRRCFWPEELTAGLTGAGFTVEWVRPRTVLSPDAVERTLRADPGRLEVLVEREIALGAEHAGESIGSHLVASAVKQP